MFRERARESRASARNWVKGGAPQRDSREVVVESNSAKSKTVYTSYQVYMYVKYEECSRFSHPRTNKVHQKPPPVKLTRKVDLDPALSPAFNSSSIGLRVLEL